MVSRGKVASVQELLIEVAVPRPKSDSRRPGRHVFDACSRVPTYAHELLVSPAIEPLDCADRLLPTFSSEETQHISAHRLPLLLTEQNHIALRRVQKACSADTCERADAVGSPPHGRSRPAKGEQMPRPFVYEILFGLRKVSSGTRNGSPQNSPRPVDP